jgi:glutathione peroxidase
MKICLALLITLFPLSSSFASGTIYEIPLKTIDGKTSSFAQFKGKTVLVVNTASQCGYTRQYADLEKLYQKYKDRNFVVAAFPSNDFGSQEPGSNSEIKKFCETRFKTSFPIFEKNPVLGSSKQPLYSFLQKNFKNQEEVGWNFEKFLVDKTGRISHRFKSSVEPMSDTLTQALESEL